MTDYTLDPGLEATTLAACPAPLKITIEEDEETMKPAYVSIDRRIDLQHLPIQLIITDGEKQISVLLFEATKQYTVTEVADRLEEVAKSLRRLESEE